MHLCILLGYRIGDFVVIWCRMYIFGGVWGCIL